MIIVVFVLVLILGLITAEALLDYVFAFVYALAAMAITNNIIHMVKYYRKNQSICSEDIGNSLLYLLLAVGLFIVQCVFL